MTTHIELVMDGPVARVILRGEKGIQILSAETRRQLLTVVDHVSRTNCSVAVFAAEGRTFIAGASIDELRTLDEVRALHDSRAGQKLMNAIEALPQTTIAAIHAACAGGGTELALACDLRFAADSAKIGLPETSIGVLPGWGGTVRATQLLGAAVARRLILTGELLAADEALRIGLVDAVFPSEQFGDEVEARVAQVLTRAPHARRRVKHLLQQLAADGINVAAQLDAEARAFAECYRNGEPLEGMSAFLEKRPAKWPEPG
jgi:enoyl-CoA hydratase/carnithine racemase